MNIEGMKKAEAMTILIQSGMDFNEAEKYWKENGGTKRTGFRAQFYDELLHRDMDSKEVKKFCEEHGSDNDAKAWTHYDAIAKLVQSVRLEG